MACVLTVAACFAIPAALIALPPAIINWFCLPKGLTIEQQISESFYSGPKLWYNINLLVGSDTEEERAIVLKGIREYYANADKQRQDYLDNLVAKNRENEHNAEMDKLVKFIKVDKNGDVIIYVDALKKIVK
jgi:hypothetical protein